MCTAVEQMLHLTQDSGSRAKNVLVRSVYLKRTKKRLTKEPEAIIAQLQDLIKTLHTPSNFRIFVAADITKLANPVSSWSALLPDGVSPSDHLQPLDQRKDCLTPLAQHPGNTAYVVPMATIDSSYALLTTKGPDSYSHPDLPAVIVAQAYLDAVEGPLWVGVRGTGLAYGCNFSRNIEAGLMGLRIYSSPDAAKAFVAAKQQVSDLASGKVELDKFALEGAVSSIVMGFADEQPTMGAAANLGFVNQVIRGIGKDWSDGMLEKVRRVSKEEVREVLGRVFLDVFEPAKTNLIVTAAEIMTEVRLAAFCSPVFVSLEHDTDRSLSGRNSYRDSRKRASSHWSSR